LDGDSVIKSRNYIKTYVTHAKQNLVIYGGRVYPKKMPASKKKRLHWKYGTTREALSAKIRNKNPYLNFQSNNFLIPQALFNIQTFDEKMIGYGYEDLLFAREMEVKHIKILHIDNPVVHEGLENNDIFLKKTENAIRNLAALYRDGKHPITRLTQTYKKLERFGITQSLYKLLSKIEHKIKTNLLSENPSVRLFNAWKLKQFIELVNAK
jgi:hypothetical protein